MTGPPETLPPVIPAYCYAITFPQLITQAMALQLRDEDILRLRFAYDLAERMFDGLYRSQGSAFINHLVRTASIAMAHGCNTDTVLASMLHSAYMLDCFTMSRRRKPGPRDRSFLAGSVGPAVEDITWEYSRLEWGRPEPIETHLRNIPDYDQVKRSVLAIRLANELEDYLDLAVLYRPKYSYRNRIDTMGKLCMEMADRLCMPDLGQALQSAYTESLTHTIPDVVVRNHINAYEMPRRHFQERSIPVQLAYRIARKLKSRLLSSRKR
jgi:(p)ppGpp synthase/HD superfamily hydrolase